MSAGVTAEQAELEAAEAQLLHAQRLVEDKIIAYLCARGWEKSPTHVDGWRRSPTAAVVTREEALRRERFLDLIRAAQARK